MLGSDEKQLQAVQAGTQEFYIGTLAPLSTRVKEVQVWDLPFMFQNEREVYAVLDGASSKKIFEKIEPSRPGRPDLDRHGLSQPVQQQAQRATSSKT